MKKILSAIVVCIILSVGMFGFTGCKLFGTQNPTPIDYPAIQNQIMASTIRACISIEVEFYNTNHLGQKVGLSLIKQGSGVIINESKYSDSNDRYYLALTNEHVTTASEYAQRSIKAIDYKGNEYTAYFDAAAAAYDLSAIYFTKTTELAVIQRESANPKIGQEIVSIGRPSGQHNAVTYGKVKNYQVVTLTDSATLSFSSMVHSAPITVGSSGGPVFNMQLKLVAINYAGDNSDGLATSNIFSCAIPIEKVNEFLDTYVWA